MTDMTLPPFDTTEKFGCIVADPPWPYHSADLKAAPLHRPNSWNTTTGGVSSIQRYGSMTLKELSDLSVKEKAAKNAHLYLWTTNSFIVEAHDLARQWGFEPKTIVTWVKKKADGSPSMKMGYYYRGATEHALFCVRGSIRLKGPPHPTVFETARLPHSVKPDYFYQMVEQQSHGPYLELFARRKRENWAVWGNELPNDVDVNGEKNSEIS